MTKPNHHPAGESETGALVPYAGPVPVDTFGGRVHVEWDPQAAVTPAWTVAILYRISASGRAFRSLGGELPALVDQPQCAEQAGCIGHRGAGDPLRPSALRPH